MSTVWFNLIYLIIVWGTAVYLKMTQVGFSVATIFLSAIFFLIYFSLPLIRHRKFLIQMAILTLSGIVFINFWNYIFNGFILIILLIIAKQAMDYLKGYGLYFQFFIQYLIVTSPYFISYDLMMLTYIHLFLLLIGFWIIIWRRTYSEYSILTEEHDQLQSYYRKLKRQVVLNEKSVRQEERNQIAREIHDSVGHRLTSLLMQLEVSRLEAGDASEEEKFSHLKSLAKSSLDETRKAVKTLKSEETSGLAAVIQLIRKLESESHLRISFYIKSGTLSFSLTNKQSVALYRSVQEALTNMMRHSEARQAEIEFSILADTYFQFQIKNPIKEKVAIEEGFGLTAMRERLEELGGSLRIIQVKGEFRLIGTFPLRRGES